MFTDIPLTRPVTPLLDQIEDPRQLRELDPALLPQLANELRHFLIYSVGKTGGHFGAGLGVVELTIALHYVYNTPDDQLVWDVGHQTYPHKILTGRRERMVSLRQQGGLSGFPKRSESPFDSFGVGHSSTSISAALGMCLARQQRPDPGKCVAIIGDGALTAGMAYEALNHASHCKADLLVVLNDNEMSISENVGGLSNYLSRVWASRTYNALREGGKKVLENMPAAMELVRRTEEHMKGIVSPGTLFEELGFNYIGPINGHDLDQLVTYLKKLREIPGPHLLHTITTKGRGFAPAEQDPIGYHALSKIEPKNRIQPAPAPSKGKKYCDVFGDWLCDLAAQDDRLVGITPAMREGSGMVEFSRRFPERYQDVAIAEQHAVTLAAGMACEGQKPVVAIYSTFLQRAYDQLIHDVAIQNLDVTFGIDRAGLVGEDGPTHAGAYDYSYLRCIPNMIVMAPADENECRQLLYTGYQYPGPAAIRYPRGKGPGADIVAEMTTLPLGKGRRIRTGKTAAILSFGTPLEACKGVAERLNLSLADMRFVKPLDHELITTLAQSHELIITVEENAVMGGAGSAVNEFLAANQLTLPVLNIGIPDEYVNHGSPTEMLANCGLDAAGIEQKVRQRLSELNNRSTSPSSRVV